MSLSSEVMYQLENPDSEEWLVKAIKENLRTPEQKSALDAADISIEDMLNGRVEGEEKHALVRRIFVQWNEVCEKELFFGY